MITDANKTPLPIKNKANDTKIMLTKALINSERVWWWPIILRVTELLDFVNHPVLQKTRQRTKF